MPSDMAMFRSRQETSLIIAESLSYLGDKNEYGI